MAGEPTAPAKKTYCEATQQRDYIATVECTLYISLCQFYFLSSRPALSLFSVITPSRMLPDKNMSPPSRSPLRAPRPPAPQLAQRTPRRSVPAPRSRRLLARRERRRRPRGRCTRPWTPRRPTISILGCWFAAATRPPYSACARSAAAGRGRKCRPHPSQRDLLSPVAAFPPPHCLSIYAALPPRLRFPRPQSPLHPFPAPFRSSAIRGAPAGLGSRSAVADPDPPVLPD